MQRMKICNVDSLFLEEVENYMELSYLRKSEIVHIYCRFKELGEEVTTNLHHRFKKSKILQVFPELSFNPFIDRIFHVFSSLKDEKMSFEDILDLASAFSEDCPLEVKARWAFLMFDAQFTAHYSEVEIIEKYIRSSPGRWEFEDKMVPAWQDRKIQKKYFDGDQLLNQNDIAEIVTRLTNPAGSADADDAHYLTDAETKKVAEIIFNGMVLLHSEGITCVEFVNEVKKIPEFEFAFRIKFL